jgi:AraC family transcriptional regulator
VEGWFVEAAARLQYQERMRRVVDYIDSHLALDLRLDELSQVAAFSKHHFQRQFSEYFGLTPHRYIQLARFKRASHKLAYRRAGSILELALDCRYESAEAFTRAFKGRFAQTPSSFRERPNWIPWEAATEPLRRARSKVDKQFSATDVRVDDFPSTPVAVLEHRGDPRLIGQSISKFISWRTQCGLPPKKSATFNIFHSDPDTTPAEDFRLDICAATSTPVSPNDAGICEGIIPQGRCAVLRLVGSPDDLRSAASYLYGEWLPGSGEELREFPIYAQRVTLFPEVPENEAVTELFLPLI